MTKRDVPAAMCLKDAEGWNQILKDWDILLGNKNHISLVAEKKDLIVGTVTAMNYANAVAWIGMMIVDKAYRGQGISKILLNRTIDKLRAIGCRCIKLDATPAGQSVYKKLGFLDEYTLTRMTNPLMDASLLDSFETVPELIQKKQVKEVIAFDKLVFGANRETLIRPLIKAYPEKSRVLIKDAKISGYVLGREGKKYQQIGPISASSIKDVMALIACIARELDGKPLVIDILEDKSELIAWLESIGFTRQRLFYRMYLDRNPFAGEIEKQYLICGPEFG